MKKVLCYCGVLTCILSNVNGQFYFPLGQSTTNHIGRTPQEDTALSKIKNLRDPNFKMPGGDSLASGISWSSVAQWRLRSMMEEIRLYADNPSIDSSAACAYGVFTFGNFGERIQDAFHQDREKFYTIYRTHKSHEKIYDWIKPFMKIAWNGMRTQFKGIYKGMALYTITYLRSFDLEKERAYLKQCKKQNRTGKFCCYDRFGKYSPFRKGAAWCYRRIDSGQMSSEYLLAWFKRINAEILT